MRIVILEDNEDRRLAMRVAVADRFPAHYLEFFNASQPMINYLSETGLYDVSLISLDNDLEMIVNGSCTVDPGDGVTVARWLGTQPAVAPIIVHTTNTVAGDEMMELLSKAGCIRERIVPYDGETWIAEQWRSVVRNLIVAHDPHRTISSNGIEILRSTQHNVSSPETILKEILRATSNELCGSASSPNFCLELVRLSHDGQLVLVTGTGFSVLGEFAGGGSTMEIVTGSADSFGAGPLPADSRHILVDFRRHLNRLAITQIQFDVVQPSSSRQAILFVGVRGPSIKVSGHGNQFAIREARALLEIALLQSEKANRPSSGSVPQRAR